jgi:curved DNA-binding protein CbpA
VIPPDGAHVTDPFRVLGLPPGASPAEVKRAYRALAKRHHPDAAGPAATARFLAIQQAYESISAAGRRGGRRPATARGERGDAKDDWYAAARDAARGRARRRAGEAGRHGEKAGGPSRGSGGAGTAGDAHGAAATPRTATFGSTTYDDAVPGEPEWHGSAWYGAASGTYWTVNPREYADPRKHGPEYLARAASATRGPAAREAQPHGAPAAEEAAGGDRSSLGSTVARLRRFLRSTRAEPRAR